MTIKQIVQRLSAASTLTAVKVSSLPKPIVEFCKICNIQSDVLRVRDMQAEEGYVELFMKPDYTPFMQGPQIGSWFAKYPKWAVEPRGFGAGKLVLRIYTAE